MVELLQRGTEVSIHLQGIGRRQGTIETLSVLGDNRCCAIIRLNSREEVSAFHPSAGLACTLSSTRNGWRPDSQASYAATLPQLSLDPLIDTENSALRPSALDTSQCAGTLEQGFDQYDHALNWPASVLPQDQVDMGWNSINSASSPVILNDTRPFQNEIIPQIIPIRASRPFHDEVSSCPKVTFTYHGQSGVPLVALLLDEGLQKLDDSDKQDIFDDFRIAPKVAYRLEWPGYTSYAKHKYTTRRKDGEIVHISRKEVVRQIATVVQAFIEESPAYSVGPGNTKWRVGPGFIELKDLVLLELRKISRGSVRPVFLYRCAERF